MKKFKLAFFYFISISSVHALSNQSSLQAFKDDVEAGNISVQEIIGVYDVMSAYVKAHQEYRDLTLSSGNFLMVPWATGFRIGTKTCEWYAAFGSYFINPVIKTRHACIGLTAFAVMVVGLLYYKKNQLQQSLEQ